MTYHVTFFVDPDFGTPGAVVVKNGLKNDQFFLRYVQLELAEDRSIHFECSSWVYPYKKTNSDRVFFVNTVYLPDKTPEALRLLRDEELRSLRGNGRGERKDWERVYDYDYYNDLGNPDKEDHARPVLGGTALYPYPRRCRTGRPLFKKDGATETRKHVINLDFYIPPDERFSPTKLAEVLTLAVQALTHFVVPEATATSTASGPWTSCAATCTASRSRSRRRTAWSWTSSRAPCRSTRRTSRSTRWSRRRPSGSPSRKSYNVRMEWFTIYSVLPQINACIFDL
jgi:hypothetical protein